MTTQFMTYISTSFAFGVLCTIPYIFYEIWKFISPALYENEAKGVKQDFGFGGFMFIVGCLVGYFIVLPLIFRFPFTLIVVTLPIYALWESSAFVVKKDPPEEEEENLPAIFE